MSNKQLLLSILLGFLMVSCGEEVSTKKINPVGVATITIGGENVGAGTTNSYPGIIKSSKTTNLSFQVAGAITSLRVDLGDYVKKGTIIASIDPSTYKEQYEASKAQANLAKENYTRINNVFEKGSIAEIRMIEARSSYKQAQAAANAAQQNLNKTTISAPFDGYVGKKLTESGAVASPGMPVIELIAILKVHAIVSLSDQEINTYKTGSSALVYIAALNKTFPGKLTEIAVQSGNQNPVYEAKITIDNTANLLKPGMTCTTTIEGATANSDSDSNTILIKLPVDVVSITDEGDNFVFIVDEQNNTAQRKIVEIGKLYNDGIAITKGLRKGDKVITSGYHKLTNNTPINILSN
ncbi:efflux transporter, RND family, MFP subunit [Cellulophaga algicola DSM 14237]|uniref:Efflux transporter, RND family, MFP subunit n=1 Tax=Cellulophaga algicola (strain DSM 14237 / IC166 / ACAM 630) TaxID=688270 RepID=E6X5E1_CELAD|nr:efflux RND transporter periplasmic adaptor subunit [Cellulophaga algicola]ADV50496.1 efflux transporter, RND family, MFP subunit [Cellulophaga algicola DSM 14237]